MNDEEIDRMIVEVRAVAMRILEEQTQKAQANAPTRRDLFAAHVLQAVAVTNEPRTLIEQADTIAKMAYLLADAMEKAR